MAGFEVIIYGRFWVIAEVGETRSIAAVWLLGISVNIRPLLS